VPGKTTTECRSRDELGGAKAHRRTVSMTFMMLGRTLELFSRHLSQILRLQTASRHRPIAFAPEGSSLDRCLPVNNPGYEFTVETSSRHTCSVFDSIVPRSFQPSQARQIKSRELNHVLQVKNDFGTYSTCVLVKEPAAFVFTFPEFRKRVGVTRDAHFDVSRILETWKFRQERGRTGFVRASATNTVVLRSTIEGEMQELKETAYWLELLEGARLCGRDQWSL
jgi:hypothetical protein